MKRLILIRHGETDYTLQRRYCGHENIPLNAKGKKQAKYIGDKLKNAKIDRIYSSDLSRSLETARIAFHNRAIFKIKGLREIDFGQFSGLTFEEASRAYPHVYEAWLSNPANAKIPKGESLSHFARRVMSCFRRIFLQNIGKSVVLISHGGPIRIILLHLLKQGPDTFWDIGQDTAAINTISFQKGIPKILRINDTSYLN